VQSVTAADLGLTGGADGVTAFGSAIAVGDLNRDGFTDVVTTDASASAGDQDVTAIWVRWGSTDGVSADRAEVVGSAPAWSGRLAVVALPEPVLALGTSEHRRMALCGCCGSAQG